MRRFAALTPVSILAALALAGCSSSGSATSATHTVTATVTKTVTARAAAQPKATASSEDQQDDAEQDYGNGDTTQAFGSTAKFSGWTLTVSKPASYTPTADAMTLDDKKWPGYKVMTVTLKNTGSKPFDPGVELLIQGNVDGNDADELIDSPLPDSPDSKILPGQTATWKVAYGVQQDSTITVQVQEFLGDRTVIFKS